MTKIETERLYYFLIKILILIRKASPDGAACFVIYKERKYSLQGTTQGRYLTGGVPPVRFSM